MRAYNQPGGAYSSAAQEVADALHAGLQVVIGYTYREPVDALVNGAMPRAMKLEAAVGSSRTVPSIAI